MFYVYWNGLKRKKKWVPVFKPLTFLKKKVGEMYKKWTENAYFFVTVNA